MVMTELNGEVDHTAIYDRTCLPQKNPFYAKDVLTQD